MKMIVYVLGFGYIALGAVMILYTSQTVEALKKLSTAVPLKYLSIIPAVFGLLFFIAASATVYPWLLGIIGALAVIKAILAFTNPKNLYSRMLDWYLGSASGQTHRMFGIVAIIFGTAILTWIV